MHVVLVALMRPDQLDAIASESTTALDRNISGKNVGSLLNAAVGCLRKQPISRLVGLAHIATA